MNIERLNSEFINLWYNSSIELPEIRKISINEKMKREEEMVKFSKNVRNDVDYRKMDNATREKFVKQFQHSFNSFFKNSFNFSEKEAGLVTESGMMATTKQFMNMAKRFDPAVELEDVFQASRNLWIINTLQIMMDAPIKLSNSIFAYSMLYPYSDNYLDDASIPVQSKMEFSARFRQRLNGEQVIAANEREQIIFDLVGLIEGDWDRNQYPGVYESLLGIHDAQTKSILLQKSGKKLAYDELLLICIEKGGTSVLADGYLINGTLTPEQETFCFGFGAFLQFVDDIQDVHEDKTEELETVFTASTEKGKLEEMVNRSIDFGTKVMTDLSCFGDNDLSHMSSLMIKSNIFLLTEAVGLNTQYYSDNYVTEFEDFSAFRFEFVRKRRSNMESNRISLMKKISSFVFDKNEVEVMQA